VAEAAQRIRYNFGTTEGEISGERAGKRRSAKHLEFLPSLLEGRRSTGTTLYQERKSFRVAVGQLHGAPDFVNDAKATT